MFFQIMGIFVCLRKPIFASMVLMILLVGESNYFVACLIIWVVCEWVRIGVMSGFVSRKVSRKMFVRIRRYYNGDRFNEFTLDLQATEKKSAEKEAKKHVKEINRMSASTGITLKILGILDYV